MSRSFYRVGIHRRVLRCIGHLHWIPKGRDRLIRFFASPEKCPPIEFEVPFFGLCYRGKLNSFIDWSVFFYGAWARHELLLLGDVIEALRSAGVERITACDVGVNVGNHSLFLATRCDRVIGFEPFEPVRKQAIRNLALNNISNVTIYPFGLADIDADLEFSEPDGAAQGEGTFSIQDLENKSNCIILPVRRGDDLFAHENLPKIDIIKLDVEGFEPNVLRGLERRLSLDRPVILMELSEKTRSAVIDIEGLRALFPDGYNFVDVQTRTISGPYLLSEFDFLNTRELLAVPRELSGALCRKLLI
jgi:FkbM family methyltransferase